jgi:RNA polymerase sigma-70 factor, ECF subfamily
MNELAILAEIRAGDTDKFGALYDAYFQKIYNYIFYRTRHRETAEDLVGATFLKAVKYLGNFDARKGNFSAWIYRIARNTLYDHYRSTKGTESLEDSEEEIASPSNVEKEVSDKQLAAIVKGHFKELSKDQQEVITMRIWDGLSYAEISEVLGKSESSCKTIFHRGIAKLKLKVHE